MPAKPVQISIDQRLLERIDGDPETRRKGRSAFVRAAVDFYLAAKERRQVEQQLVAAYGHGAPEMETEVRELLDAQAWPTE